MKSRTEYVDEALTRFNEAVRDELLNNPTKTFARIAIEYGTSDVTVAKIAKHYGITRSRGRHPKAVK